MAVDRAACVISQAAVSRHSAGLGSWARWAQQARGWARRAQAGAGNWACWRWERRRGTGSRGA